ncbi:MAG: GIY-YIG nuclease family protein [Thermoproteus sp. AZ2]|uniref:GIY-YIG nuclease family protein n=1 Tax=Thermoproteus sp. AZ2 TaxID=1609232 RepID=A0ACC6V2J6_9CREN|nr:MAG: endonuclease [Thermoproteus sp. AZ2]
MASYIVLFKCPDAVVETRAKRFRIAAGLYAYVGSCGSSCWGRVGRHLKRSGKKFWHADYLPCSPVAAAVLGAEERELAALMAKSFSYVEGFGSSDDESSPSHLFRLSSPLDLTRVVSAASH